MPGGRPPKGPRLVDALEGSEGGKRKLRVLVETMSGEKTIEEACAALGVKEAMVHVLRRQALRGALEALEPKPIGRPRKERNESGELESLREQNAALRLKIAEAGAKEELLKAFPRLAERVKEAGKKTKASPQKW